MSAPARLDQAKDRDEASGSEIERPDKREEASGSSPVPLPGLALGRLTVAGRPTPLPQVKGELLAEAPELASVVREGELDLILAYLESRNYACTLLSQLYGATMNLHKEFEQFSAEASNPVTWAALHRLRGGQQKRGFADFLRAKSSRPMGPGDVKDTREVWGSTDGKYEPDNFGGGHTWPRNAEWLDKILGRRVILTDVPLRRSNLMCKVDDDGKPVEGFVAAKHFGVPSAYAREIAALLDDGYVGLWGHELKPTYDQLNVPQEDRAVALQTFVMVPDPGKYLDRKGNVPAELYALLDRRRHVDRKFCKSVASGAKVHPDEFAALIGTLELAGMPVIAPRPREELDVRIAEAQERQRSADEHQRRSEQGKLTSTKGAERLEARQRAVDSRESKAAASSEILADDSELELMNAWLVRRLTEMGRTRKTFNPSGKDCATLLAEGKKAGWFGPDFSAASLKRHIKDEVAHLLPEPA